MKKTDMLASTGVNCTSEIAYQETACHGTASCYQCLRRCCPDTYKRRPGLVVVHALDASQIEEFVASFFF